MPIIAPFLLALSIFAVYRVARMVTMEDGPFGVFSWIQDKTERQETWWQRGLHCPLCVGFWLSLIPALLFTDTITVPWWLAWLAIAGGSTWLQKNEQP